MQNRIEEQVLVELRRIIRATQLSAKRLARASGLTTSQLLVLQLLKAQGELAPRQIAEAMNLTQATVTILLDRLQERGLIDRRRSESDRRKMRVELTAAGSEQLRRSPQSLQERFLRHFATLERWEQTAILSALQRVAFLLDAASLDAAAVLDVGQLARRANGEGETG